MAVILYESSYYGVSSIGIELEHHGIKGQKWYQRRFQNEDGTLTALGRLRYGIGEARRKRSERKEEKRIQRETAAAEKFEKNKMKAIETGDLEFINNNLNRLSNEELNSALTRIRLNKAVADLTPAKSSVLDKVTGILDTGTKAVNAVSSFKNATSKLAEAFKEEEAPEDKATKELEEERSKAKIKSLSEIGKLVAKNAWDSTDGDTNAKAKAAQEAYDALTKDNSSSKKDKDSESKRSFSEFMKDVKNKADEKSAAKAKQKFENEQYIKKLEDINANEDTGKSHIGSQSAFDSFKKTADAVWSSQNKTAAKETTSKVVKTSGSTTLSSLFKKKSGSASETTSRGQELYKANQDLFERSLSSILDEKDK